MSLANPAVSPRKPGRPISQNQSVLESILKSAELLIAEKGFAAITLKDVSQHSCANSAMVAYYFGSKAGLSKAVLQKQFLKVDGIIRSAEVNSKNPQQFWKLVTESLLSNAEAEPYCHRIHMWVALEGGQLIQDVAHGIWNPVFAKLTNWLKELRPDLKADEIEARCSLYCGSFQQYANWLWVISPSLNTKTSDKKLLQKNYKNLLQQNLNRILQS